MENISLKLSSWSFIKSVTLLQPQPSAPEISRRPHSIERPLTNYITNFQRSLSKIPFWRRRNTLIFLKTPLNFLFLGKPHSSGRPITLQTFRKSNYYHFYNCTDFWKCSPIFYHLWWFSHFISMYIGVLTTYTWEGGHISQFH